MRKLLLAALLGGVGLSACSDANAQYRRSYNHNYGHDYVQFGHTQPAYRFGARSHMVALSGQMYQKTKDICWEMHHNYHHMPGYRDTYREMYQVMRDAKHIHDEVHRQNGDYGHHVGVSDDHIARDLHNMDRLFQHLKGHVVTWTSQGRAPTLAIQMLQVESTLLHLMQDYGVRSQLPVVAPQPSYAPPQR